MRHRKQGRSLGRVRGHRQAMLRNLATSLVLHEHVVTTEAKAKEIRTFLEPLITRAATNNVATIRAMRAALAETGAADKLVKEVGPKYKDRPGGYLRLTKLGPRGGDGAEAVKVELV